MTEELQNAVWTAKHLAGVAIRADERGEAKLSLCAKGRDACRAAMQMASAEAPKDTKADIKEDWDAFWAEVTEPNVYDVIQDEIGALEEACCKIIRNA